MKINVWFLWSLLGIKRYGRKGIQTSENIEYFIHYLWNCILPKEWPQHIHRIKKTEHRNR